MVKCSLMRSHCRPGLMLSHMYRQCLTLWSHVTDHIVMLSYFLLFVCGFHLSVVWRRSHKDFHVLHRYWKLFRQPKITGSLFICSVSDWHYQPVCRAHVSLKTFVHNGLLSRVEPLNRAEPYVVSCYDCRCQNISRRRPSKHSRSSGKRLTKRESS